MNEPFRIRHARPIVVTSTLAILAMVAGVGLVRYARATKAKNTYLIQADQAQLRGLRKTMDVRMLGEPVGVITDVRYSDVHPSDVEVEFTVNEPKLHKLFANSRVIVSRTMAVGAAYLEIERATDMLGMIVRNLSNDEANQMGTRGVMVVEIARNSPASMFDLRLIDQVITSVNDQPVEDVRSYYEVMNAIVPGTRIPIELHAIDGTITLDAAMVTSHRVLPNYALVQQFEPEESSFETITEKLGMVQESIANVESSMVDSLSSTDTKVDSSILPAFTSITTTSDAIREKTLVKANEALDKSKNTLDQLDKSADKVSKSVLDMVSESAVPAFDQFNTAAKSLEKTSLDLRKTVDTVGTDTSAAIKNLTTAIATLQEVLDKSRVVVETLERESKDLPGTAKQMNSTMQSVNSTARKAQTTIDGINEHWLLRRSVKRAEAKKTGQAKTVGPLRRMFGR